MPRMRGLARAFLQDPLPKRTRKSYREQLGQGHIRRVRAARRHAGARPPGRTALGARQRPPSGRA
eukprot:10763536-Alexandrium_andersonii.AAC.1